MLSNTIQYYSLVVDYSSEFPQYWYLNAYHITAPKPQSKLLRPLHEACSQTLELSGLPTSKIMLGVEFLTKLDDRWRRFAGLLFGAVQFRIWAS